MAQYEFSEEAAPDDVNDYRAFFDSRVLRVWHLKGREITLTIERVNVLVSTIKGQTKKQPQVYFKGAKLPLALNKTNAATIAQLYGAAPKAWEGKRVTLFATTTTFGSNTVECIRIRPQKPATTSKRSKASEPAPSINPEPEEDETPPEPGPDEPASYTNGRIVEEEAEQWQR